MRGITVELQHLVAASAVFCRDPGANNPFETNTTQRVYWEALRAMAVNPKGDLASLRVVIDIVAGTSAGGINGIVLAKALAQCLRQDPLRTVWFDDASLFKLLMRVLWPFRHKNGKPSSWAPLNGRRMSEWAYGALQQMNKSPVKGPAAGLPLVPQGNELDLFVTPTTVRASGERLTYMTPKLYTIWNIGTCCASTTIPRSPTHRYSAHVTIGC
jgi:predicted acylesterase/phospholipase RssA